MLQNFVGKKVGVKKILRITYSFKLALKKSLLLWSVIKYPCSLQEQTLFNFTKFFFPIQCWLFDGRVSIFFVFFFFKDCKVDHDDSTIRFSLCEVDFLFQGFRAIANVVQFQQFLVFSLQCWLFDGSVSVIFNLFQ